MRTAIKILGIPVWERSSVEPTAEAPIQPVTVEQPVTDSTADLSFPAPRAHSDGYSGGYANVFSMTFDGEKNQGELGPIREYYLDHASLRLRSWQLFIESEICQTVFKRFARWVIGSGLKLQAEPQKEVLASEKINIEPEAFNESVEARFKVYSNSTIADHANTYSLHDLAESAFMNAKVGGDVLVVLRVIDGNVTVQLIDGAHLGTPNAFRLDGNDYITESGNRVRHGIELDARNQPVAFHVRKAKNALEYDRIVAREPKTNQLMAYMVYGLRYRLDNMRGMPLITAVMETAKKLERYKEAVVGSAEERQKIAFAIEHGVTSTGSNPFADKIAAANGFKAASVGQNGELLADKIASTTNKQVVNLDNDTKLVQLASTNELNFSDFYTPNINIVCATVGIPPNVAMMLYDDSFSASRASIKDWEHTLTVERNQFAAQYYQPIYRLWLYLQVRMNKITAPGFLEAIAQKNRMAIEAYVTARWEGANVPHIDPEKEVRAERLKLGPSFDNHPLTTLEAATAALSGGDCMSNMEQASKELKKGNTLGFKPEEKPDPGKPDDKEE